MDLIGISMSLLTHQEFLRDSCGCISNERMVSFGRITSAFGKKNKDLAKIIQLVPSLVKENVCMPFSFKCEFVEMDQRRPSWQP